jgi:hypothetical protein
MQAYGNPFAAHFAWSCFEIDKCVKEGGEILHRPLDPDKV